MTPLIGFLLTCRFLEWMKRQGHLAADNQVSVDAYDSSTPSPIDAFLGGSLGMGLLAELKQGGRGPSTAIEHQSVTASKRVRAGVFNVHAATSATSKKERERQLPAPEDQPKVQTGVVELPWHSTPLDWATLLRRVYNIDALTCLCGGRLKFVELVE